MEITSSHRDPVPDESPTGDVIPPEHQRWQPEGTKGILRIKGFRNQPKDLSHAVSRTPKVNGFAGSKQSMYIRRIGGSLPNGPFNKLAGADDFMCFDDDDCTGIDHGDCDNITNICDCTEDYADKDCSHKRKSQKIAFILELVCGFCGIKGVSFIYLGHTGLGVGLMILGIVGLILVFIPIIGWIPGILCILGAYIWWIITWVNILILKIHDSDGYALKEDL